MSDGLHSTKVADALKRVGLLPSECRHVEIHVGVDDAVFVRYEVMLTGEQLHALGQAFCAAVVSDRLKG